MLNRFLKGANQKSIYPLSCYFINFVFFLKLQRLKNISSVYIRAQTQEIEGKCSKPVC